jgi:hypothetical protein
MFARDDPQELVGEGGADAGDVGEVDDDLPVTLRPQEDLPSLFA